VVSDSTCDVLIAGGAVTGCAAAYFLMRELGPAARVWVVERDPSYAHCATTRSAASIRHQFSTPQNIAMSMFGTEFLHSAGELLAVDGDVPPLHFCEGGYLFLAGPAGLPVLHGNHAVQRQLGADVALLTPRDLHQRFPWLNTEGVAGASLGLSGEGWFDAHALMHGFRKKAVAMGARFVHAEVQSLVLRGDRVVEVGLSGGQGVQPGWVINAAGTGAAALAQQAGIALPVQARKRCVFHFRSPERAPGCPLLIDTSGVYVRPEGEGFIAGVAPPEAADPECLDFEVDWALWEDTVWPTLAARVPGFEAARVASAWAGHYDVNLLDANVILGPHPAVANLLFANGFSGHGLQQSPAVGRALAEWVAHGAWRSLDLSALGWSRVLRGQPLHELNVV
jgi:FAD-dependent oxidoreductase domain-containing protein 1